MFNWLKKTATTAKQATDTNCSASTNNDSEVLKSQGNAYFGEGRLEDAAECYRQAIALNPYFAEACSNLGYVIEIQGNPDEAIALYRKAIALNPDLFTAHSNLGVALMNRGETDAARECFQRVIALDPEHAVALQRLGVIAAQYGDYAEAETLLRRALVIDEDNAALHANLGQVLKSQARLPEAMAEYRRAIQLDVLLADAHYSLGTLAQMTNRIDEAEASYRQALQIRPFHAETHNNLGGIFKVTGRMTEAEASFRKSLQIRPEYVEGHYNLGIVFQEQDRMVDAEACYRRALEINPDYADVHNNLGVLFKDLGRMNEAEASYRAALNIKQDDANIYSNLAYTLNYNPDKSREEILTEHRQYDELFCLPMRGKWQPHGNSREPQRRLKIGYVSPDLRSHSVAFFLEPLLRKHDRQAVEVYCYAEVAQPDAVTVRLQGIADHWRTTIGMSDENLARQITNDGIDILVDLAGHTSHNRLPVFSRKPAPIQVTWLGYPHSTGLSAMDYRLVDAITDPQEEADTWASETLVRLENGFLCYAPPQEAPAPSPPPCLKSGIITFGSFNNPAKLSSATLDVWAGLLDGLPTSQLLVKGKCFADDTSRAAFLKKITQRSGNIGAERVKMLGLTPGLSNHLRTYEQMDIALDPFPYNGTTTTCEALWMGVPVVTLCGDRHAGRVGASLLTQIGIPNLIANSPQAYIDIAIALAENKTRLQALHDSLRERMAASPLCDAPAFARKMEAAYRNMWHRYCAKSEQA